MWQMFIEQQYRSAFIFIDTFTKWASCLIDCWNNIKSIQCLVNRALIVPNLLTFPVGITNVLNFCNDDPLTTMTTFVHAMQHFPCYNIDAKCHLIFVIFLIFIYRFFFVDQITLTSKQWCFSHSIEKKSVIKLTRKRQSFNKNMRINCITLKIFATRDTSWLNDTSYCGVNKSSPKWYFHSFSTAKCISGSRKPFPYLFSCFLTSFKGA